LKFENIGLLSVSELHRVLIEYGAQGVRLDSPNDAPDGRIQVSKLWKDQDSVVGFKTLHGIAVRFPLRPKIKKYASCPCTVLSFGTGNVP
jgi:hypothetical protein